MSHIKLNQGLRRIEVTSLEIENDLAFEHFDKLPADQRDAEFLKALYIGVLALRQDRLAAFMARTNNELGTELETLKMMYEMKSELFAKSTVKGAEAELHVRDYLVDLVDSHSHADEIDLTGNSTGVITKNKTGDLLCRVDGDEARRVVIECKFDKSIRLGEIEDVDWYGKKFDTALSQLIEAQANRDCHQAIIVFDKSSVAPALLNFVGSISFRPKYGFIVIVDSLRGDYQNLGLAYLLARDLASANPSLEIEHDLLLILIERIIADANRLAGIRSLVEDGIKKSQEVIDRLEQGRLSLDFCRSYLKKFLETGTLTRTDFLDFYSGKDLKFKHKSVNDFVNSVF
ncbi:MAG: hypothetical protein CFE36_14475 [Sphingomonadaceae bacterium PASS1]|nr:MAG: hypothetical protein CFE36_14475 [Sphingomonadaceae bacterium PASS1]